MKKETKIGHTIRASLNSQEPTQTAQFGSSSPLNQKIKTGTQTINIGCFTVEANSDAPMDFVTFTVSNPKEHDLRSYVTPTSISSPDISGNHPPNSTTVSHLTPPLFVIDEAYLCSQFSSSLVSKFMYGGPDCHLRYSTTVSQNVVKIITKCMKLYVVA